MAQKVRFSARAEKVFSALEPDNLRKTGKVPDIGEVEEGARQLREKHNQIQAYSKFKTANGFSNDGTFQTFGRINNLILREIEALHEVDCACGKKLLGYGGHKEWLLLYIAKSPYSTKGELV